MTKDMPYTFLAYIDAIYIAKSNIKGISTETILGHHGVGDWKNQGAFLVGWGSPFDPDNHTYKVFTTNGGDNFNAYSNSKIDKLLTEARHIDVFEERLKYYQEFQE